MTHATLDINRYFSALTRDVEGIWLANDGAEVSYPAGGHAACLQVEDSSFWFRHRNRCIAAAASRYLNPIEGPIFDVGGGNGFVARGLEEAGFEVVLVEPGIEGARNARRRGLSHVVCATTDSCGFQPRSAPAIGLFDVVEHIEDDKAFLESMAQLLVEQGRLLLTVPAHAFLWSAEDRAAGHFRRYTRSSICAVLERSGFSIDHAGYIFRPLLLPILLMRAIPYRLGLSRPADPARAAAADHAVKGGAVASWLERILSGEVKSISRGKAIAFGASILVVARSCR